MCLARLAERPGQVAGARTLVRFSIRWWSSLANSRGPPGKRVLKRTKVRAPGALSASTLNTYQGVARHCPGLDCCRPFRCPKPDLRPYTPSTAVPLYNCQSSLLEL